MSLLSRPSLSPLVPCVHTLGSQHGHPYSQFKLVGCKPCSLQQQGSTLADASKCLFQRIWRDALSYRPTAWREREREREGLVQHLERETAPFSNSIYHLHPIAKATTPNADPILFRLESLIWTAGKTLSNYFSRKHVFVVQKLLRQSLYLCDLA